MTIKINGTNTVANPSITGTDTDTGLVYGTGEVKVVTDGTERLKVDSSGKVGIGTSSPNKLLDVRGDSSPEIKVSATNTGTNSAGLFIENQGQRNWQIWADRSTDQFRIGSNSRALTKLAIDSSGNVGIGTSAPTSNLHIQTAASSTATLNLNNTSGSGTLSQINLGYTADPDHGNIKYTGDLIFHTGGNNERLRIDSAGKVGINCTDPKYLLHLQSNSSAALNERIDIHMTNDTTGHTSGDGVQFGYQNVAGAYIWNFENTPVYFATNNSEKLRILPTGGITFNGDTATANALDDYEEGTWTPTIDSSASGSPTVSYSEQSGTYTKIGNIVTVFWDLNATSISGASGIAYITGLPFVVSNSMAGYSVIQHRSTSAIQSSLSGSQLKGFAQRGSAYLYFQVDYSGTAGFAAAGNAAWGSGGRSTGYTIYTV